MAQPTGTRTGRRTGEGQAPTQTDTRYVNMTQCWEVRSEGFDEEAKMFSPSENILLYSEAGFLRGMGLTANDARIDARDSGANRDIWLHASGCMTLQEALDSVKGD